MKRKLGLFREQICWDKGKPGIKGTPPCACLSLALVRDLSVCVPQDPDGEHARRAMQKVMAAGGMGIGPGPGGPGMINIPPSILNNPNIPNEIIHALQAGRLGSTVFVANVSAALPREPLSWALREEKPWGLQEKFLSVCY